MTGVADVPALRIEVIGVGKLIVQAPEGGHIEHILYVVQVSQQGTCWMVSIAPRPLCTSSTPRIWHRVWMRFSPTCVLNGLSSLMAQTSSSISQSPTPCSLAPVAQVYRRVITFTALFQHLATAIPNIAPCPVQPTLTFEEARDIQGVLQDWMEQLDIDAAKL